VLVVQRVTLIVAGLAAGMSGCGPRRHAPDSGNESAPAALSPRDSVGIATADSAFQAAANSGDAARVAAVYALDASLLPPNLPLQRGRNAIRGFWAGLLDAYTVTFEIAPDLIEGRGDLAYNMGHYRFTAVPKSKSEAGIADEGKFVEILKKQSDGSWRYVVDIYNSNLAPHR
jgi:uncharacterized protein (TIGR02246 family)